MYQGISTLQPAHQVAQKSNNTTLPLELDSLIVDPYESTRDRE
jgi:hypothetical protein